jgi:hypothetical protein
VLRRTAHRRRERDRARARLRQPGGREVGRVDGAAAAVDERAHHHAPVVDDHVLDHVRVGEARERAHAAVQHRLHLRARMLQHRRARRARQELQDARLAHRRREPDHRLAPTCTRSNRAGAHPWPTWMICIGSPLPQNIQPQTRQSSPPQIASQRPQNSGVMPV